MARPKSIARQVADDTGLNIRTVQRVLKDQRQDAETTDCTR